MFYWMMLFAGILLVVVGFVSVNNWGLASWITPTCMVGGILLIVFSIALGAASEKRQACAELYTLSRTHSDTMAVAIRCKLGSERRR